MTTVGFEEFVDPVDGTRWRVDVDFLSSRWRCVWGEGCQGILDEPAEALQQGCCSVGVEVFDDEEAMLLGALAATLDEQRFQNAGWAAAHGVFRDAARDHTAVVGGACVFFNKPGFPGGAGCALHLQAVADGDRPIDVKPTVCWQVPLRIDDGPDGTRTLRRWARHDWGPEGETMAWCCTEADDTQVGEQSTADELADELQALCGPEVAVAIRDRCR